MADAYSLSFGLTSAGRSAEYTEVPLGALDIAAADSLTLSPHHGRFMIDTVKWICNCHHHHFYAIFKKAKCPKLWLQLLKCEDLLSIPHWALVNFTDYSCWQILLPSAEGSDAGDTERLEELPLCSCRMEAPRVDSTSHRVSRQCMATESINGEVCLCLCLLRLSVWWG